MNSDTKKSAHLAAAVGKRKTSVARVWLRRGAGSVTINGFDCEQYFTRGREPAPTEYSAKVNEPFIVAAQAGVFDALCTVKGGGMTGQAEALRHALAKALVLVDQELRPALKARTLLTRDSRKVERKKYGHHKARKKTQFSKR